MKRTFFCLYLLIASILTSAQVPGTWNEYFSFRNVQQLESVDDNVFALSGNGIFIYNTTNQEIQKITKLNGLSNVGLTCFAFCDSTSSFLIGYSDGTLDILHYPSLKVQSIPTIAQKNIYGSKKINRIVIHDDIAILASDFAVFTFSMTTKKFISTTILSNDGSYVPAKSVTFCKDSVFAATTKGIFSAKTSDNLSDFSNWNKLKNIPFENDTIAHIASLNGIIYYAHKNTPDAAKDSIFKISNGKVEAFKIQIENLTNVSSKKQNISIVGRYSAKLYDTNEKLLCQFDSLNVNNHFTEIVQIQRDFYIGDECYGLYNNSTKKNILPNGPISNHVTDLVYQDHKLHSVYGSLGNWENLLYSVKTKEGGWYGHSNWKLNNSVCVYPIPQSNIYYIGTYGYGFTECQYSWVDDQVYNNQNSPIKKYYLSGIGEVIYDITSDTKGNIWMINSGTNFPIVARDKSNNWYSFYKDWGNGIIATKYNVFNRIYIDKRGYKWLTGTGYLTVFYENGTLDNSDDDVWLQINLSDNEGTIATTTTCVTEDLNGEIWVGTNQGIALHSSPARVFKDRQNISRIKIEIDGEVGYLLSSESITCIAIDGANRKWIGTENSGVFLISENGTKQLLNFTKTNSPLPSNTVTSITIDHETGEVYIGSDEGLVSYIGDATAGDMEMKKVYVFPNPVRETYDGEIYIKGIVENATIKITDISGNLVRTIESNGGTATWDGRNTFGDRVKTGVYLVYISDETGEHTTITKILFIN